MDKQLQYVSKLLKDGMDFEGKIIVQDGPAVRELSKNTYGSARLDARMTLIGIAWRLLEIRNGKAGTTSHNIEERLTLITAYYQGIPMIETLISEGQYIKTAAAIKQDYEIVARLGEIRQVMNRQYGKTPNVRFAPANSQRIYGELNDVAHITRHDLLVNILGKNENGDARGLTPFPVFVRETAIALYEVHLFTLLAVVREHFQLLEDMYNSVILSELTLEMKLFVSAIERLGVEAGWNVTS